MAEDQAKAGEAIQTADQAIRQAEAAKSLANDALREKADMESEEIRTKAELSREIIILIRKTPHNTEGLVEKLTAMGFDEETVREHIPAMQGMNQMYLVGSGESAFWRYGQAQ